MEQSYTQSTASVNGAKNNTILNVFKKDFKQALLDAKTAGKEIGFGIYASPDKQLKLFNRQKDQKEGFQTHNVLDVKTRPPGFPDLIAIYHCHPINGKFSNIPSGCLGNKDVDCGVANDDGHKAYFFLVGTFVWQEGDPPKDKEYPNAKELCHSLTKFKDLEAYWQMWVVFNAAAKPVEFK